MTKITFYIGRWSPYKDELLALAKEFIAEKKDVIIIEPNTARCRHNLRCAPSICIDTLDSDGTLTHVKTLEFDHNNAYDKSQVLSELSDANIQQKMAEIEQVRAEKQLQRPVSKISEFSEILTQVESAETVEDMREQMKQLLNVLIGNNRESERDEK